MVYSQLFSILTQTRTLWFTFAATLSLTLCFGIVMHIWQFVIIDEMYNPDKIIAHLNDMSATQKTAHVWMTATLDVVYPFAYGSFFIGMTIRFFEKFGRWLAIPAIAVIPVDLAEGLIQVLLLTGNEHVVGLKAIVTPLKLGLFIPGLIIALIGAGIAVSRWLRRPR